MARTDRRPLLTTEPTWHENGQSADSDAHRATVFHFDGGNPFKWRAVCAFVDLPRTHRERFQTLGAATSNHNYIGVINGQSSARAMRNMSSIFRNKLILVDLWS